MLSAKQMSATRALLSSHYNLVACGVDQLKHMHALRTAVL
jgi:hypothetical protein